MCPLIGNSQGNANVPKGKPFLFVQTPGVHFFEGWVIAGCFGHAVSPRAGMLSGS